MARARQRRWTGAQLAVALLVAGAAGGCVSGGQCADCCPPGDNTSPITIACQVARGDGGAASGLRVSCSLSDAGAVTDATGAFSFGARVRTCGIAGGSDDCGTIEVFEDGGAVGVVLAGTDGGDVYSTRLQGGACKLIVR